MGPGSAFLPRFSPFSPTAEPVSRLKEVRSSYYDCGKFGRNGLSTVLKYITQRKVLHIIVSLCFACF